MRKSLFRQIFFCSVFVFLVSLTGCTGLFLQKKSTASITICLPEANSKRSVSTYAAREETAGTSSSSSSGSMSEESTYSIDDVAFYRLILTPSEGEPLIQTVGNEGGTVTINDILPGTYTLKVQALLENTVVFASGTSNSFEVTVGENTEVAVNLSFVNAPYTLNSCRMIDGNPSVLSNSGSTLSFNISEDTPLIITDANQTTRSIFSLAGIDVTNYEDGTYTPFITADNKVVLIRDYEEGTEFAAAYETIGSPSVADNGTARGFSESNYLMLNHVFDPKANTWEYVTKITTGENVTNHQTIKGSWRDCHGFYICIQNSEFSLCAGNLGRTGSDGGPWSFTGDSWYGAAIVTANTVYYLRVRYTGSAYTLEYSLNGVDYTNYLSITPSNQSTIYSATRANWGTISADIPVFGATAANDGPSANQGMQIKTLATIHMNDTYFKVADEYYWTGEHGYTSAARMDTSNGFPVLRRMTENGPAIWDAVPLTGATVSVQNGKVISITQPAVSE